MYGPVRTVVWQGSVGDRRPYANLVGYPDIESALLLAISPSKNVSAGRHPSG